MPGTRAWTFATVAFAFAAILWGQDPVAKGIDEFHHGRYEAAKATLQQAVKQDSSSDHGRTFLALARAATGECDTVAQELADQFTKNGSAQESDRAPISCGFLKGYEFYLRCGQALGLQQQIA
jgi:hypothetical protein